MNKLVACSEFVKRQTAESGYSHYAGTWSELEWLTEYTMYYHNATSMRKGYKPGVYIDQTHFDEVKTKLSPYYDIHEDIQFSCF